MSKIPKYVQLEKQVIELEKQRLKILIKMARANVTRCKGGSEMIKIAEKNFPKGDFKKYNLKFGWGLEQSEMYLENLIHQRKELELRVERLVNYMSYMKKKGKKKSGD